MLICVICQVSCMLTYRMLICKEAIQIGLSEAKKAADKRYTQKLDQIMIRPYKEEGVAIRAAAANAGQSVQAYVLDSVRWRMKRDQAAEGLEDSTE